MINLNELEWIILNKLAEMKKCNVNEIMPILNELMSSSCSWIFTTLSSSFRSSVNRLLWNEFYCLFILCRCFVYPCACSSRSSRILLCSISSSRGNCWSPAGFLGISGPFLSRFSCFNCSLSPVILSWLLLFYGPTCCLLRDLSSTCWFFFYCYPGNCPSAFSYLNHFYYR